MDRAGIWLLLTSIGLSIVGVLSIVFRRRPASWQKQRWKVKKWTRIRREGAPRLVHRWPISPYS